MRSRFIIFFLSSMLLHACSNKENTQAKKQNVATAVADSNSVQLSEAQIRIAGIRTGPAGQREIHTTLKATGVLDLPPQNIVSVSAPLGGYLKTMRLIPGQKVSKGSILATLEDQQYIQLQQDYLVAQSRLQFLEADYTRQKGLNATKATSDKVLQQVQSEFNSQQVLARSLAEKLRLIGIRPETLNENNLSRSISVYAPISGYVSKVNANIGKYVSAPDVLFELINPRDLHLRLTVFENDAAQLSTGQKIRCFTNSNPSEKYTATIHFITPNIEANGSTDVHCHLNQAGKALMPGTYMNAVVELSNAMVTAVPDDALVKWNGRHYIFTEAAGNRFRMLPVDIGVAEDGYTEIRSPLPSQKIVMNNAYTLLMKMKNSAEDE